MLMKTKQQNTQTEIDFLILKVEIFFQVILDEIWRK